jgi:hypothetical protein
MFDKVAGVDHLHGPPAPTSLPTGISPFTFDSKKLIPYYSTHSTIN